MNNEKFIKKYIELLTSTMTEAIQKNIVLQTEKKVLEEDQESLKLNLFDLEKLYRNHIEDSSRKLENFETFKNELAGCRGDLKLLESEVQEKKSLEKEISEYKIMITKLQNEIQEKNKTIESLTKKTEKQLKKKEEFSEKVKDAGSF